MDEILFLIQVLCDNVYHNHYLLLPLTGINIWVQIMFYLLNEVKNQYSFDINET